MKSSPGSVLGPWAVGRKRWESPTPSSGAQGLALRFLWRGPGSELAAGSTQPPVQVSLLLRGLGPGPTGWPLRSAEQQQVSPGPGVAVGVLQQQALVARQHVRVVVFHQAAHAHKQDFTLQVELRVLGWRGPGSGGLAHLPAV